MCIRDRCEVTNAQPSIVSSFEKYRSVAFQQALNHQNRFTGMQKACIFSISISPWCSKWTGWCHVLRWHVAMKRPHLFFDNYFEKYRSVAFQQAQNHQNRFEGRQKAFIFSNSTPDVSVLDHSVSRFGLARCDAKTKIFFSQFFWKLEIRSFPTHLKSSKSIYEKLKSFHLFTTGFFCEKKPGISGTGRTRLSRPPTYVGHHLSKSV